MQALNITISARGFFLHGQTLTAVSDHSGSPTQNERVYVYIGDYTLFKRVMWMIWILAVIKYDLMNTDIGLNLGQKTKQNMRNSFFVQNISETSAMSEEDLETSWIANQKSVCDNCIWVTIQKRASKPEGFLNFPVLQIALWLFLHNLSFGPTSRFFALCHLKEQNKVVTYLDQFLCSRRKITTIDFWHFK